MIPAIFPLLRILPDGTCQCKKGPDCKSVGKCPGYAYSNLSPGEQRLPPPGCGYGIVTGTKSGFFVVDLDIKDSVNGVATFLALAAGRPIPATHETESGNGRGGVHLRFRLPKGFTVKNSQGKLGPGIDVRGEGGFVVGPGSPHKSGGTYRVTRDLPVAEAPAWLLDLIQRPATKTPPAPASGVRVASAATGNALTDAATLLRENLPPTQRHLVQLAIAGACVRGGWSDDATVDFLVSVMGERSKREQTVADTRAKHLGGEPYTGFAGLETYIPAEVVRSARKLMGMSDEIDLPESFALRLAGKIACLATATPVPTNRKQRRAEHKPAHVPGFNAAQDKCRAKVKKTDLIRYLMTGPWEGVWQYDEFAKKIRAVDPPVALDAETTGLSDRDLGAIETWFETIGILASDKQIYSAVGLAAANNAYHPVREYLLSLPRPSYARHLDTLAARVLGNATPSANVFLRLFLVAAVRRILVPGTKVDTMVVLYSPKEGRYKSTFVEVLFSTPWYKNQMPTLDGRDASHALEGSWGIELPELDAIVKSETSTTKDFLSRSIDKYRAFGTGEKVEYPRQCVFVGTTNYPDILESDTGNRRFWIIEIFGDIDLAYLTAHRDEIWAEAVALAQLPAPLPGQAAVPGVTFAHWLDKEQEAAASEARVSFEKRDIWHEAVEAYCAGRDVIETAGQVYLEKIAVGEDGALSRAPQSATNRIGAILRKLGWCSVSEYDNALRKTRRIWRSPKAVERIPQPEPQPRIFS